MNHANDGRRLISRRPCVQHFYDDASSTLTYVVSCPDTGQCAIVDPVLDFCYPSGTLSTQSADAVIDYVRTSGLTVDFILETHVHADHLTAAPYLQAQLGGAIAIGRHISIVQGTFGAIFAENTDFARDGSQFNTLFNDQDAFNLGQLKGTALHVPGHTPACMAYLIGDALFLGDTLFMPDAGTARCDFPGGDAGTLFRSIQRLLTLPDETRVFVCHDYQPNGRDVAFETTIASQRSNNIHISAGVSEQAFVTMRESRDRTLDMPTLILPSLQVNMRAGFMPAKSPEGRLFFKVPINAFGGSRIDYLP